MLTVVFFNVYACEKVALKRWSAYTSGNMW